MSRIEFLTNGQPVRQIGSQRYAELGGVQNLIFRALVSFDDSPDFTPKMPVHATGDFHKVTLCIYEDPAFEDPLLKLTGPTLRVMAKGPAQSECIAFISTSPSFFAHCTAANRQLLARLGFETDQGAWWPKVEAGRETVRHTVASRVNVSVVA